MQNIKSVLIVAFTATIGVLGFAASAQASQDLAIQGRGQVKNLSIPADTAGFTLVVIDGPGKLATDESYGPFSREESSDTEQHFSATEESTESVNVQVLVIHTSSRDVSTLRVVLDHEEQEGAELPRAAFGLRWTQPTWGDKPHGALDGGFRFEKSIWKYSNLAFSGEVEYAGEKLQDESAKWARSGSTQDDLRVWAGVGARPRFGTRWGVEGGFGLGVAGADLGSRPLGLRLTVLRPVELGNWLELGNRTQLMVGLSGVTVSEELGADAAWFRWGTKLGQLSLTAGGGAELRYENAINGALVPRIGAQWAIPKLATLRLRLGFAVGTGNGIRTELSITPY